ncbi:MAG: hypothetical protein VX681_17610 [Myxococcota bacterium]|nr:hypothetical protein [Myxococcota bacterium]
MTPRSAVAALVLLLLAPASQARELWSAGGWQLDFSGSLRQLLKVGQGTDLDAFSSAAAGCAGPEFPNCPAFLEVGEQTVVQSLTRLRARLDLQAGERVTAVLVYDQNIAAGHLATLENGLLASFARESFWGAESVIASGRHAAWSQVLYRGYLTAELGPLRAVLGRQRIAWGEGRLWNPIDRLNAIGPLAIEPDQSPGVDAIDLRWNFSGFDYLELVYAPARDPDDASYAARWHGVLWDTDWSMLGGWFEQAPTVGFDGSRNLGNAAVRFEAVWTDPGREVLEFGSPAPREPDDFWQVVVSLDTNLDVGSGLYLLVEQLYNGGALGFGSGLAGPLLPLFQPPGVPASRDRFGTSRVVTGARNLTGVELGYDLTPELRGDLLSLVDWSGRSLMLFPSLVWSPSGSVELSLGVQVGVGPTRSEYGDRGAFGYLLGEWFF